MDFSLQEVIAVKDESAEITTWRDIIRSGTVEEVKMIVAVKSVYAIVATQDCDAVRSPEITLCEISSFQDVEGLGQTAKSPKAWQSIITQQARKNQKWFYLPPDPTIGFDSKMAVDFRVTIRVPREDLEELRSERRGRLNRVADEHFRERISDFFRRYPYDEWYALDSEELAVYQKAYPDATAFPWQQSK